MPFTSISPNFPQPQNLLPPSCPDNFFSLLHLSWLPLLTFDSFVNHPPPTSANLLPLSSFFLSFLKRLFKNPPFHKSPACYLGFFMVVVRLKATPESPQQEDLERS